MYWFILAFYDCNLKMYKLTYKSWLLKYSKVLLSCNSCPGLSCSFGVELRKCTIWQNRNEHNSLLFKTILYTHRTTSSHSTFWTQLIYYKYLDCILAPACNKPASLQVTSILQSRFQDVHISLFRLFELIDL